MLPSGSPTIPVMTIRSLAIRAFFPVCWRSVTVAGSPWIFRPENTASMPEKVPLSAPTNLSLPGGAAGGRCS